MGEDKGNYKVESVEIQITRQECPHEHTELVHKSKPTYTEDGYTGDIQCIICNEQRFRKPGIFQKAFRYIFQRGAEDEPVR